MVRVVLLALMLIPSTSLAQGIFTTPQGYRVFAYAKHSGDNLYFDGRCDGGPTCKRLVLVGSLENQRGESQRLRSEVENAGVGGRLYRSDPVRVHTEKSGWRVVGVSASCVEP